MEPPIAWSAKVCPTRGAGAYTGLAPCPELLSVASRLNPRRVTVYAGASTQVGRAEPCPLVYFAVRDPSAVRVVPVRRERSAGSGVLDEPAVHVHLLFRFSDRPTRRLFDTPLDGGGGRLPAAVAAEAAPTGPGAFMLTIGLAPVHETMLYRNAAIQHPDQPWEDLCARIGEAGRLLRPAR
jgi:hypothetical protein